MASENKKFFPKVSKKTLHILQVCSSVLGLAVSIYLVVHHVRLKNGMQTGQSFCNLGQHIDCDAVSISQFGSLFEIPLGSYGAAFYFLTLILSLWASPKAKGFNPFQRTITWLALAALAVDLALLFIQAFKLHNFCIVCSVTYLATTGLFITAALLQSKDKEGCVFKKALTAPLPSSSSIPKVPVVITTISLVCFVIVLLLLPSSIMIKSAPYANVKNASEQFFDLWKELPIRKLPVKAGDGTWGNSAAKVQIVEFSDFQCPFCQRSAFAIHELLKSYQNRLFFVFKNYPLDSECNKAVGYQMHIYACRMARLAYCAAQKGKFWDFHDTAFFKWQEAENTKSEAEKKQQDSLLNAIKAGMFAPLFNEAEYNKCLNDPASMESVRSDTELGTSMGITGTPTVYINGKHVSIPMTPENLHRLIEIEETLH